MTTFNITMPDDYVLRIGRVTVAWGSLEHTVDLALWKLSGFKAGDPRGAIIAAHMSWQVKLDALEALVGYLLGEYPALADFSKVKPLLKEAQAGRNLVCHGSWNYENGQVSKLRITARGQLKISTEPFSTDELDRIFRTIGRAQAILIDLVMQAHKNPSAVISKDSA